MKFTEMLKHLQMGNAVTKKSWGNDKYIYLDKTSYNILDNKGSVYTFDYNDFNLNSWDIHTKLYNFEEALNALFQGCTIFRKNCPNRILRLNLKEEDFKHKDWIIIKHGKNLSTSYI